MVLVRLKEGSIGVDKICNILLTGGACFVENSLVLDDLAIHLTLQAGPDATPH